MVRAIAVADEGVEQEPRQDPAGISEAPRDGMRSPLRPTGKINCRF